MAGTVAVDFFSYKYREDKHLEMVVIEAKF